MPVTNVLCSSRFRAALFHPMCALLGSLSLAASLLCAGAPRASAQALLPVSRPGLQRQMRAMQARGRQLPPGLMRMLIAPPPAAPAAPRPITRLLVKLKPGVDHHTFAAQFSLAARHNANLNAVAANKPLLQFVRSHGELGWSTYAIPAPEALQTTLNALRKDPRVLHAEPDYGILRLSIPPPNNHYWGLLDWEHTYAVWGLGDMDQASAYNDDSTTWDYSWSLEQVSAPQAWNIYPGHYQTAAERMNLLKTDPARLPVVGDIDTGVDLTHPNFSYTGNPSGGINDTDVRNGGQLAIQFARSFTGPTFDGYQGDDPTLAMDDYGHGTGTTGIIVSAPNTGGNDAAFAAAHSTVTWTTVNEQVYPSAVLGLGFPAQVVPLKIFDAQGDGSESDIIDAIMYACADWTDPNTGITHPSPHCVILNMSLALNTTNYPQALQDAVDFAWNHGTLIVAAAGNDGAAAGGSGSNTPRYPARCDKVLAVSATTYDYPQGGVPEQIATYSNYGDQLGIAAPGGDAQQYNNSASGDFAINPVPELILPLTLQPSYTAVLNDPQGQGPDSQYAVLGFAGPYLGEFPGTSFAAPHVTGLAALYASEHRITQSTPNAPQLIVNAIERGADSMNGFSNGGYDPVYGWGRINAAATIKGLNNRNATVGGCIGRVRYVETVVGNATVTAKAASGGGITYSATTDPDGLYHLSNMPAASTGTVYNVTTAVFGGTATTQVTILPGCDQLGTNLTVGAVPTVKLSGLKVQPSAVLGSLSVTGTVTLTASATANFTVNLTSSNPTVVSVPASVTIPSGSSSQTFTINTSVVASATYVTISAVAGGVTKQATLKVNPIGIKSITVTPSSVTGSLPSLGMVALQLPAAPGNVTISLASSDASVAQPVDNSGNPLSSITIAAGNQSVTFSIATTAVTAMTPVSILATANGVTKSVTLKVQPISLQSFTLSPSTVKGGTNIIGTVTLTRPAAPGNITVTFGSNSTAAPAPASITIPAGSQTGTVTITTTTVTANTTVTLTATANGITKSGKVTVTP